MNKYVLILLIFSFGILLSGCVDNPVPSGEALASASPQATLPAEPTATPAPSPDAFASAMPEATGEPNPGEYTCITSPDCETGHYCDSRHECSKMEAAIRIATHSVEGASLSVEGKQSIFVGEIFRGQANVVISLPEDSTQNRLALVIVAYGKGTAEDLALAYTRAVRYNGGFGNGNTAYLQLPAIYSDQGEYFARPVLSFEGFNEDGEYAYKLALYKCEDVDSIDPALCENMLNVQPYSEELLRLTFLAYDVVKKLEPIETIEYRITVNAIPTPTATPAVTPVATVRNCGNDLSCFKAAAASCSKAEGTFAFEADYHNYEQNGSTRIHSVRDMEIRGPQDDKCTLYFKILSFNASMSEAGMNAAIAAGYPQTLIDTMNQQLDQSAQAKVGNEALCYYPPAELTGLLDNWSSGTMATTDFDDADCTGTYFE
ncbi:hypothetical protein AUJ14_00315 [Candidatus Micrarchaeota archaeon CG1_02_55_22]|nr:MAG: hypothetical protein AUJ14_00315 [Candidatus Micrarchaeota archaeon CG1_02_55_22]